MHRLFALALFVAAFAPLDDAQARTYKCQKGNSTVYQSAPCESAPAAASGATPAAAQARNPEALAGCYELPDRSRDLNRPQIMRKKISVEAGRALILDAHSKQTSELRPATPEELLAAGQQFKTRVDDGLVSSTGEARPSGLYRAGNRYFGEFPNVSAPAIRTDCNW